MDSKLDPVQDGYLAYSLSGGKNSWHGGMILERKEEDGIYPVTAMFNWHYDEPGGGMALDDVKINAEAEINDCGMIMTGTYYDGSSIPESERAVKAMLEQYQGGLRLIVLECDSYRLQSGDWFDFLLKNDRDTDS